MRVVSPASISRCVTFHTDISYHTIKYNAEISGFNCLSYLPNQQCCPNAEITLTGIQLVFMHVFSFSTEKVNRYLLCHGILVTKSCITIANNRPQAKIFETFPYALFPYSALIFCSPPLEALLQLYNFLIVWN